MQNILIHLSLLPEKGSQQRPSLLSDYIADLDGAHVAERKIAKEGQMAAQLGKIQPLRELLLEIGEVDIDQEEVGGWLFLPKDERWKLDCPAVLLELNAVPAGTRNEKEVETPELAKSHQLKRVLSGADIQGIIDNARQQKPDVDLNEIFGAILYYWEFDAYKDFYE